MASLYLDCIGLRINLCVSAICVLTLLVWGNLRLISCPATRTAPRQMSPPPTVRWQLYSTDDYLSLSVSRNDANKVIFWLFRGDVADMKTLHGF